MKLFFTTLLFIGLSLFCQSQITPSSCTAHDSILDQFREDAERITLDRIFDNNYTYVDSIVIPTSYSDTILNALVAVYNLTGIPERDTVIDLLNIHVFKQKSMSEFIILADSSLSWMQNLSLGVATTGEPTLDNILLDWGFSLFSYTPSTFQPRAYAHFTAPERYNLTPIIDNLYSIPGVIAVSPNNLGGDASTIYAEVTSSYVDLSYRYAWGDCPAGCTADRLWNFRVYNDCSVEFIGSTGESLPQLIVCPETQFDEIIIYPNPFSEVIYLGGIIDDLQYRIFDVNGKEMHAGKTENHAIYLESLASGTFQLELETTEGSLLKKIVKK